MNYLFGTGTGNLSTTRINNLVSSSLNSTGNALPDAVILGQNGRTPPTEIIEDLEFEGDPEVFAETFAEYSAAGANGSFDLDQSSSNAVGTAAAEWANPATPASGGSLRSISIS